MSEARDVIFAALESAALPAAAPVARVPAPAPPPDPLGTLRARVELAGGRCVQVPRADWPRAIDWPVPLREDTPMHEAADLPGGPLRPGIGLAEAARAGARDALRDPHEAASLSLCALRGEFAVIENGAVWHVPASAWERAAALLAEHLVVVVEAHDQVASMHQAYDRIELAETGFGWFLCGPSKTADIEQSLVLGAHGPRTMMLVLLERD